MSFGRLRPRHEHRADEQVHLRQQFEQVRPVRVERVRGVQRDVEEAHPLHVHFENGHVRAEALGHARGVDARGAAADDDHLARQHARHAAEQHAAAAVVLSQEIAAHEHAHAPGDLAHRLEQRQAAVHLDGFVGDAGDARSQQRLGQRPARGEVQVGEEDLPGPQQGVFVGSGSFTFTISVRRAKISSRSGRTSAPALRYSSSGKPAPTPAPLSTRPCGRASRVDRPRWAAARRGIPVL